MGQVSAEDLQLAQAVSDLNYANPFLPERLQREQQVLGDTFEPEPDSYWSLTPTQVSQRRPNLIRILDRARAAAERMRRQLSERRRHDVESVRLYDELTVYVLFYEVFDERLKCRAAGQDKPAADRRVWNHFSAEFDRRMGIPELQLPSAGQKLELFELFHQILRAFFNIFDCVIGRSAPAARLRARIWQSIFTHDMRRYRRTLQKSWQNSTTLITGPSGSGKDLVAQAVGLSRRIPFDPETRRFAVQPEDVWFAVNISAFSTGLVESELFGHAKGAYTDANAAREGWLEACGAWGAVLLDEIGELDLATQVKLLRVLQNRQFQRVGETRTRNFEGKIIAATNRDLRREIENGRFREDLYYRLCADIIETPSLAEQAADNPDMLQDLVRQIAGRICPDEQDELAAEVLGWISQHVPADYHWPGNIRELEQCVRNVLICGSYVPASRQQSQSADGLPTELQSVFRGMAELTLTADEVLQQYCRFAYRQTASFEKAAKLLQLDRRTVRTRVDQAQQSELD
ncbi:MAG: sigma 54-interacting transcriptional regulator [Planctomyces sp.]|nr:sigma 54-interacting transcriptional regulator [Planctomyces sp.]